MKNIMFKKATALAVVMLFVFVGFALAQPPKKGAEKKSPAEMAKMKTEKLAEKLSLSEEQKEKVYAILLKRGEHLAKVRKERKEKKAEMKAHMEEAHKELLSVLNDEQKEKLEKWRKEKAKKYGKSCPPGCSKACCSGDKKSEHKKGKACPPGCSKACCSEDKK